VSSQPKQQNASAPAAIPFAAPAHDRKLDVLHATAVSALSRYGLPRDCRVNLVNLSENATYRVDAPDGRRMAMRLHRDGYHSEAAIRSELAWLTALRVTGVVTTPRPLAGRDGDILQRAGHPALGRPRHVVLFGWEDGVEPAIDVDLRSPFEALGEITARMHRFTRSWPQPPGFERFTWDFNTSLGEGDPHWGSWRRGMGMDSRLERLFGRTVTLVGQRLARYGKAPERFGLVHGDLRLANLLIDGEAVKVIDFDDCGFGWAMYDAATPLSFYEHEPQAADLIEHWKAGYRRVLRLAAEDEAEIPTFVMLRRLLLVAWIASHAETDLARAMGVAYTEGTAPLCEAYLSRFS
jgi:Ser/Thr protein kinase RdoA (MazF antagonist)